ncbi:MAG: nucleoside deaminase [Saprospiraceae bacterium]
MIQRTHEDFMREAIRLSVEGMRRNAGGPFGAVIVQEGKIIGRGYNAVLTLNDPTAHAEVMAIRDACKNLSTFKLDQAVLYTSCEPCPMCLSAIYWARIGRFFYGNDRAQAAAIAFDDALIYNELNLPIHQRRVLAEQLLADEAHCAFREWQQKLDRVAY